MTLLGRRLLRIHYMIKGQLSCWDKLILSFLFLPSYIQDSESEHVHLAVPGKEESNDVMKECTQGKKNCIPQLIVGANGTKVPGTFYFLLSVAVLFFWWQIGYYFCVKLSLKGLVTPGRQKHRQK